VIVKGFKRYLARKTIPLKIQIPINDDDSKYQPSNPLLSIRN
jgi:hypothetical protein